MSKNFLKNACTDRENSASLFSEVVWPAEDASHVSGRSVYTRTVAQEWKKEPNCSVSSVNREACGCDSGVYLS